jgi:hypothetical protein
VVLTQVHGVTSRAGDLLQDTLGARSGTEVVQPGDCAHHGSNCSESRFLTKTNLRANTVVEVRLVWSVKAHFIGVREDRGITVGLCLKRRVSAVKGQCT